MTKESITLIRTATVFLGIISLISFYTSNRTLSLLDYSPMQIQHSLSERELTTKAVEALACNDTTVIISSNFIPISPSLAMINRTIQSLNNLRGLCPTSPLIITVDGINRRSRRKYKDADVRLAHYVQALKETFNQDHHTILAKKESIELTNIIQHAMYRVKTEFVYIIQHDMPFVQEVNHTALLKTLHEYPDVLRLVRFNLRPNEMRDEENRTCYNESTPVDAVNGINLIKTWIWSDNNHLTRKSYYDEMFKLFQDKRGRGNNPRFMEWFMRAEGERNCTYWGTFYYGKHGLAPTIGHLDGKRAINTTESESVVLSLSESVVLPLSIPVEQL